jgi:hypothetical protein
VWNSNGYESKLSTPVIGWLIHVNTENKLKSVVPQVLNFDPYPNVHKSVADWLSDFSLNCFEAIKAVLLACSLRLFQALAALWFVASARFAAMGDTAASACASLNNPQTA